MAVDRPTFSENWYRVCELKPKLRANVQTYRQQYRGNMWYVVRDQSANQFFRLNDAAFHFVGLLDGKRTIAQAWDICNEALGDRAPTQGEAIQLLGQLYTSNLLHGDMPADAIGMFDRYHKRMTREIRGYLMNMMFIRIPLFDPERILEEWHKVFGWFFGKVGFLLWMIVVGLAAYMIAPHLGTLWQNASPQALLETSNLMLLYLSFGLIKLVHEFGHGFACKRFGKVTGSGGEVHTMGIMLLVFMPVPYVDASSSWAFRNRWHRAFVGAAGMYVELFVASIFAIIWTQTSEGSVINALSYNIMFIASISTLLFNGNPLLRYDGYYILSDILEIPNMSQRGKDYFYYLVKKYIYRARNPRNPAHSLGERIWLILYWAASTVYRIFICAAILLYIAGVLFFIGFLLAVGAVATWVFVPLGKFIKFLATSPEIARTRGWSIFVTVAFFAAVIGFIAMFDMPDRDRADGVVEPRQIAIVHMSETGKIDKTVPTDTLVKKGEAVVVAINPEIETRYKQLQDELKLTQIKIDEARKEDPAEVQRHKNKLIAIMKEINRNRERLENLKVKSEFDGKWVSPEIEQMHGAYVQQGERLGLIANTDDIVIRVVAPQYLGPRIFDELKIGNTEVELKVKGYPDMAFTGVIEKVNPAGNRQLPSPAIGIMVGGSIEVDTSDQHGTKAAENIFIVTIKPKNLEENPGVVEKLLSGQRVVARFTMPEKPLGTQWYRAVRQLVQKRFQI